MRSRVLPALLLLAMSLFANAAGLHAQKLRVAYTAFSGTFAILWVGKDSGLYQKHGVDLELLFIGASTTAVQALLAGDVDVVYSAAGAVVDANLARADLIMVGCQYDTGQTSFFATAPITSVAALKGKAVGVSRFSAFSDFVARHVLKKKPPPADQRCRTGSARRHAGDHCRYAEQLGPRRFDFVAVDAATAPAGLSRIAHDRNHRAAV
jgi:ABC-type nitrate/sulfonate/bicarbonate transport system substrate-binding protein